MLCHGELYILRPRADHLTTFYLMVSIGGALGGLFVSLVAPLIFNGYWEFFVGLAMTIAIVMSLRGAYRAERSEWKSSADEAQMKGPPMREETSSQHGVASSPSVSIRPSQQTLRATQPAGTRNDIVARSRVIFFVFGLVSVMLVLVGSLF
jgi:hypothetical protein